MGLFSRATAEEIFQNTSNKVLARNPAGGRFNVRHALDRAQEKKLTGDGMYAEATRILVQDLQKQDRIKSERLGGGKKPAAKAKTKR